jgi:hypothetical protein
MDTIEQTVLDIQTISNLVAYQQAVVNHKNQVNQILKDNETALEQFAKEFFGEYTIYQITYAVLAFEETEGGDDEDFSLEYNFGVKGKKATVEKYEGYALDSNPDENGFFRCFEPNARWGWEISMIRFARVAKIERHTVVLSTGSHNDTNAWCFPRIDVENANVDKFGHGRTATLFIPPEIDVDALKARIKAVMKPVPPDPKYQDFGISLEVYRALRSIWSH